LRSLYGQHPKVCAKIQVADCCTQVRMYVRPKILGKGCTLETMKWYTDKLKRLSLKFELKPLCFEMFCVDFEWKLNI